MKSRALSWKSVVLTFVIAAAFYVVAYTWLSRRQTGKGPWQVHFNTNSAGVPQLTIAQTALGLSNIVVQFPGEQLAPSNHIGAVAFAKPRAPTPFGVVIYDDLMFQPGDVTLDCFGHIVEMVPRALGLNSVAYGWTNNTTYILSPTNKLSAAARAKLKGGYRR
jgi:hypothetical protein